MDFQELEASEAVLHLRNVVLTRLPWAPRPSQQMSGEDYVALLADDACEEQHPLVDDFDVLMRHTRFFRRREARGHNRGVRKTSRHCVGKSDQPRSCVSRTSDKTCSDVRRKSNPVGRWCSLVAALLRQEDGWGTSRRRLCLRTVERRRNRELELGLDKPERMRRYERWLRSPFLEEEIDRSICRLARHGCAVYSGLCEHHVESKSVHVVENAVSNCTRSECVRCGCSSHLDSYGDRICWCDSCHSHKSCQLASATARRTARDGHSYTQVEFIEHYGEWRGAQMWDEACSSSPSESSYRWERVVAGVLKVQGTMPGKACVSRRQVQTRRLQASASEIRRWARLHDSKPSQAAMDQQRALLWCEAPPQELTLSYHHFHIQAALEASEQQRCERRMRSRWSRMFLSLRTLHWRKARREALREDAIARAPSSSWTGIDNGTIVPGIDDEVIMAAQLGLDVATYRMLRQLEQREILPEDYDLLGRLDEPLKPRTLNSDDLARFEIRTYIAPVTSCVDVLDVSATLFAMDYWRLPLPALAQNATKVDVENDVHCFGADFWKLPMSLLGDDSASTCASDDDGSCVGNSTLNLCGVCLVEFDSGDEIRVLPCDHHFHRECIDQWLLNCSTACPVDKRDLA